jgi:hypothetical protein
LARLWADDARTPLEAELHNQIDDGLCQAIMLLWRYRLISLDQTEAMQSEIRAYAPSIGNGRHYRWPPGAWRGRSQFCLKMATRSGAYAARLAARREGA